MHQGYSRKLRPAGAILARAVRHFSRIDGPQWAAAFAHYAFFSLFPLIVLFVNLASAFIARDRAREDVVRYIENYVPSSAEIQGHVFDTINGVVKARGPAGLMALLILAWTATRFLGTLIRATNRAWGAEAHQWWRLPIKSLLFLGLIAGTVLCGIAVPVSVKMARARFFPLGHPSWWLEAAIGYFVPLLVVFGSLTIFYKLAPRRRTRFSEVWMGALCATALLRSAEDLFVVYLQHFASLNLVYGAFGGIMAFLLWIYLSGCIFIFGACICAAQGEGARGAAKAA
ncbi:MAG TPA: YihY/virulence factor BrkB family protein [Opitutaceae bacterium]|nr:YihY/virulence factor BrkB family protein [Opitutaceae bacterium]